MPRKFRACILRKKGKVKKKQYTPNQLHQVQVYLFANNWHNILYTIESDVIEGIKFFQRLKVIIATI